MTKSKGVDAREIRMKIIGLTTMHTRKPDLLHIRLPAAVEVHLLELVALAVRAQLLLLVPVVFLAPVALTF